MPSLDTLDADNTFHRLLYVGESGAGKTGSLISLVEAGYKVRMIDLDNGFGILRQLVKRQCPDKAKNVGIVSFRDKFKANVSGVQVVGSPRAFIDTLNALDKWPDDETDPATWGSEYILVLDSLTQLGRSAYAWNDKLNPTVKDKRQVFYSAQQDVLKVLQNLTAESFQTNVIVCTHLQFNESETKAFPTAIGKALGKEIPALFNNYVLADSRGSGEKVRRIIRTSTDGVVGLKNEKPFDLDLELPLETGLATIFEQLKG